MSVYGESHRSADFYADGLLEAGDLHIWEAYYSEAPLLIAVRNRNNFHVHSNYNGIYVRVSIISLSTDESWKCTDRKEADWYKLSFKDSHWENASVVVETHNGLAKWIWATTDDSSPAYCRHVMGEY